MRDLVRAEVLRVEDGNHGEYRPRPDEFVVDGTPFIRAADMTTGVIDFGGAGKINDVARARIRKGIGAPGDVILSHKGTVGRVAVAPMDAPDFVCSPQTTFWRSLNQEVLNQRYLRYAMQSPAFIGQLDVLKGQTDMAPYVSLTDQRCIVLDLPSIAEQEAIAEILGGLDEKIGANTRVVQVADELAEATTLAATNGHLVQLVAVAEVTMGSSPPGTSYNEQGAGVPFYQGVRDFGVRFPNRRVWTTSPVRVASSGDTLVSVRAPVGRTNLANEAMCIGRGIASLRSRNGHAYTLFHQVRLASEAWMPYEAEGTVFGSINKSQLEAISIPAIGAGSDDILEERLAAIEHSIAAALGESRQLADARDELLPLLMSGRIRVRDAEKVVEEVV